MPKTLEERRAYEKIYYARNREKLRARQAAYRAANPARYRAQEKRYRQRHREQLREKRATPERQAYTAAWWEKNRGIRRQKDREKYAENRLDIRKKRKEAYAKNPEPSRIYGAVYRQKNREKVRAQNTAYAKKHPEILAAREARRRARKNSAPVNNLTAAQWKSIKEHYGHCCVYCGRHMERLTQDHIIPISQGGSHTVQNVVPACMTCNVKKGTKAPLIPVQPLLLVP